ncbi:DUF192 domain-containing protein [Euhalothece natronophila Z-M001]|uniref:DUF192 domain-containing protein n=1 Tax=Euhalothece natronophila Z-M001 TaxID=522448 RepID=A0A5B8NIK4_9CHRO|nr:DUF192 domain-containing protein [Euhalothece natronophila]QDZ38788.1 DUF192 domain-containing protein [Euhalothece natronophila Z-M001]
MLRLSWVALFCCLLLMGCASNEVSVSESEAASSESQGQKLPITAEVEIGGELIKLEVARTPEEQAMGLMYREELAANRGMLFPLEPPRIPRFWMKNVEIPLDMIFISEGEVRAIAQDVPPCRETPCPTYGPDTIIDKVLELRGGRAEELQLEVGDSLSVEYK